MTQRVLSVGQCGMDHGSIARVIESRFDARVTPAESADEALAALRQGPCDLLLVNRQFDADGDSGLDFLRLVKADPALSGIPAMLVSNYPDVQQQAVAAGALPGFGKSGLHLPQTIERLAAVLTTTDSRPA